MLDFRILDADGDTPIAWTALDPVMIAKNLQSPSHGLEQAPRRHFDTVLDAIRVRARHFACTQPHNPEPISFVFCSLGPGTVHAQFTPPWASIRGDEHRGRPLLANLLVPQPALRTQAAAILIAVAKTIQTPPSLQSARFVEPMQCLAVAKLPEGPDWEYEIKFDGYRALGIKSRGTVRVVSRNENDFSGRFPSVARGLSKLPDETVVDGEIVALDETGMPSFNVLQNYNHAATPLQFYAFDLLHFAGKNLRDRPLDERRDPCCRFPLRHSWVSIRGGRAPERQIGEEG